MKLKNETLKMLKLYSKFWKSEDVKVETHYKLDQTDHRVVVELFEGLIVEEAGLNAPG